MRANLIQRLACPECYGPIELDSADAPTPDGHVMAGRLGCRGCGASYPVVNGVPRLISVTPTPATNASAQDRTAAHFHHEFTALAADDRDIDPSPVLEHYFYSRTGIDEACNKAFSGDAFPTSISTSHRPTGDFLAGKHVLDAGCGPARFVPVAAARATHVVGLDLGDHVDRAFARCRSLPNVEIVQGSVLVPPFRLGTFDYVYSIGVLHHTPDPRLATLRLSRLLRRDGAMSLWVYPPEYWGGLLRKPVSRVLHRLISRLEPHRSFRVCANVLYPIGLLQRHLARRKWTKMLAAPLFILNIPRHPRREVMIATIHDYFGPAIISTHTYEEVREWLIQAGFTRFRRVPIPTAWFADRRDEGATEELGHAYRKAGHS